MDSFTHLMFSNVCVHEYSYSTLSVKCLPAQRQTGAEWAVEPEASALLLDHLETVTCLWPPTPNSDFQSTSMYINKRKPITTFVSHEKALYPYFSNKSQRDETTHPTTIDQSPAVLPGLVLSNQEYSSDVGNRIDYMESQCMSPVQL